MRKRWALFLSGRGSTAQSVLDLLGEVDVALVVSSRKSAYGLKRARRHGVPTMTLEKNIDWDLLQRDLLARGVTHIFLLGFMRIVPEKFVNFWQGRIFNVHPSLLPDFPGAHGMTESFQSENAPMGVTVHEVTPGMDEGPRLLQKQVLSSVEKRKLSFEKIQTLMAVTEQRLIRRLVQQKGVL